MKIIQLIQQLNDFPLMADVELGFAEDGLPVHEPIDIIEYDPKINRVIIYP